MNDEKTIDSRTIYTGRIVNLKVDTVEITGKGYAQRELISHRGGVCCVAVTPENKILLVKQFRKAVEKSLIELPAGTLEMGETPEQSIIREMKEETGYRITNVEPIVRFYPSPGYTNELGNLFFADAVEKGERNLDSDEDIEVLELSLEDIFKKIEQEEIVDAKTMLGVTMYKLISDRRMIHNK